MDEAKGLFAGLKVLDVASFIAAPAAATVLGDFGADVIKIEPPGTGDPYRQLAASNGMPAAAANYCWMLDARNKQSLALDLKTPQGRDVLYRLVAEADVFITNFPPEVRRRLGVAYEQLEHVNPRLIYASFTAFGESGAEANQPGFDSTAWWARSGMMDHVRPDGDSPPARSGPGMGDHPTALALYAAIVTALFRRERTGRGGCVGSSLLANGAWANAVLVQAALCGASFPPRLPRSRAANALRNHYLCRDGRWFMLALVQEEKAWPRLARVVGGEALADDPRFATTEARRDNAPALIALLDDRFLTRDSALWQQLLAVEQITATIVSRITDVASDSQMHAASALVPYAGGNEASFTVDSPFWIEGEAKIAPGAAPEVGQHTEAVLQGLGYSAAEIAALRREGAIA